MRRITKAYWVARDIFWIIWNALALLGLTTLGFIVWALINYQFIF
jgi:hypothetical protein